MLCPKEVSILIKEDLTKETEEDLAEFEGEQISEEEAEVQ
jgi:hypothetical protein